MRQGTSERLNDGPHPLLRETARVAAQHAATGPTLGYHLRDAEIAMVACVFDACQ